MNRYPVAQSSVKATPPIKGRLHVTLPKGKKTRVVGMPSSVAEVGGCAEGRLPCAAAHLCIDHAGGGRVCGDRGPWLGHSSPAITLGYYAHFMPEAGSKGRTAIDRLMERQGDLHASRDSPDSPQG